ncbi:MAG: Macrolide export ATP-binding/permease protein MacB [Candidatus Uhrbacteria bacterium GW2011_GWF2_41_16]|uniref:Macrolide export ATP-binding/permease protein MacB n=2 Tax=Candidatus Uhriibacteriota TaxID=1752732 RepID=A0A0G0VCW1_9BACT|nr:MAG: Macrolide export ATP-binding/permease protein MacB [Candidatus Uhrbacteria bacterium GW2011_GWA2_41_10]KKR87770.1 MAG: Macrolide export ATP-binding/permease protein MacB [Candidatus Uhrbacteria bacterium GW2011_GWC2_41_11]KKR98709.1 MAG: Macrolide export ATP-binding/permease protein MacB [Candidatus Uhrbacteria bacterium GW2011_GWF2_41_16]
MHEIMRADKEAFIINRGIFFVQLPDLFMTASSSLSRNKSRSILTILGIVIGIAAVILMLSIGQSAQGLILNQVADLGSDLIFIEPSSGGDSSGPPSAFVEQTLKIDDAKALERSGLFMDVSSMIVSSMAVSRGEESKFSQVTGVTEGYLSIFPADVAEGRFIERSDVDSYARVAVLGKEIAQDLFGDQDPIGKEIKIKQTTVRVIGVLAEQGSRFFQNLDQRIAVPVTTAQRDIIGLDTVNFIAARTSQDIESAKDEIRWILRAEHDIDNPENDVKKDDFIVSSQSDAVEIIGIVGGVLTILLSSIAAISLVVGGIGIMNIMLVSVTERTKEIGLRKAVGATYSEILQQFLLEAVLLTMLGGIIGVLIGVITSRLAASILASYIEGWQSIVPMEAVVSGVVVATTVGIIFGLYPARRAAHLDPIEALRYE